MCRRSRGCRASRLPPRASPRSRETPRRADSLAGIGASEFASQARRTEPDVSAPRAGARAAPARRDAARLHRCAAGGIRRAPPQTDHNLAEMAQRLEAALRRPKPTDISRRSPIRAAPRQDANRRGRSQAAGPPEGRSARARLPSLTRSRRRRPRRKSLYDSLEQEMASLLGRPNRKT